MALLTRCANQAIKAVQQCIWGKLLQRFSFLLPIAALVALAAVIAFLLPTSQRDPLILEHGLVEISSVVLYLVGAVLLVTSRHVERVFGYWTAAILLLCAAREMDVQRAFTSDSMTKSRYYLDESISLSERIIATVAVLLIAALIVLYIRRYFAPLVASLRARDPFAHSIVAALVLAPASKLLDGAHRQFEDLTGRPVSDEARMQIMAFEEVFELGIPVLVLCAFGQFVLASRSKAARRRDAFQAVDSDARPRH